MTAGPARIAVVDERAQRRTWWIALFAAIALVFLPAGAIITFFLLPTAIIKLALFRFRPFQVPDRFVDGEVRVDGQGLVLKGEQEVRCGPGDVVDGWIEPWPEPAVVLRTRDALVCARTGTHERAEEILEACGRTAATNVTRMRIVPTIARVPFAGLLTLLSGLLCAPALVFLGFTIAALFGVGPLRGFHPSLGQLLLLGSSPFVLLVTALLSRPRLVQIGRDQVALHGPFGTRRVSIDRITRLERTPQGVLLIEGDRELRLDVVPWYQNLETKPEPRRIREALFARIAASCRLEASAPDPARLRVLVRGKESAEEHRAALRRMVQGSDYRSEVFTVPELLAVVAARDVDRPVRVAAALALSESGDTHACDRARELLASIADEEEREEALAVIRGQR